jgi:hypothetical protein
MEESIMTCEELRAIIKTDPEKATNAQVASVIEHNLICEECAQLLRKGPRYVESIKKAIRVINRIQDDPEVKEQIDKLLEKKYG